ncbi:MAG: pyridoxamine 5'-phosphate oxidase family protein [Nitrosopumilaceae archaeon]|jgi:nitroimidazol reductase NimA-like FMN-containing flavoprotein (pyridoxamine 5'-phosphate oxidase superfamily)|nr:MAG: Pyridoxamine 5'-phosphate oxidase [Nitrosopumilales archaeon]
MKIVHASPGFGSELTETQTIDFLSKSKLNLLLGTIDESGEPNVHPVWYIYDNGKLYVETAKTAKKTKNIRNKNSVYFCVDDETIPYKGVRGKGTVRILEDIQANIPIAEKIMIKYTGNLENEVAKFLMDGVKNGFSVLLEITPKYFATWDHSSGFQK